MPNDFQMDHVQLSYGPDTILKYTKTHTHTHMDRVNFICPSAILWPGHKRRQCAFITERHSVGLIGHLCLGIMHLSKQ